MEIDDELWQGLQAALLMRCRDKIAAVRAVAASAMVRLQVRESLGRCPNCCQSHTHALTHILEHRRSSWRAPRPHVQRVGKMYSSPLFGSLKYCAHLRAPGCGLPREYRTLKTTSVPW